MVRAAWMEKIMSKTNAPNDHRPLADNELNSVSGGIPGLSNMTAATGSQLSRALQGLLEGLMFDTTIEVQFFDVGTWRTYARGVPNEPVYVNRTMQECARAFAGRRIRAVDDSGRVVGHLGAEDPELVWFLPHPELFGTRPD
jgi:hypothetical protein